MRVRCVSISFGNRSTGLKIPNTHGSTGKEDSRSRMWLKWRPASAPRGVANRNAVRIRNHEPSQPQALMANPHSQMLNSTAGMMLGALETGASIGAGATTEKGWLASLTMKEIG